MVLQPHGELSADEASKLGMKNEEDEVEKFVAANTQELGKDKWLCPLSGKKFKGPDFVRKHIFNKHGEKVDEVKKEVRYYNNYLKDPRRPQLPESTRPSGDRDRYHHHHPPHRREHHHRPPPRDPYSYSGYPREATNYPVYEERGGGGGGGWHDRHEHRGYDRGYRGSSRGHDYGGR